ncbi:MAG: D-alanyl-D-alanine carboxypeptidase [Oscillospiraceae bacterium]|nr:D-alanyl-D-alanine carboxypeptidase [Oscillospiraceae bacterium]
MKRLFSALLAFSLAVTATVPLQEETPPAPFSVDAKSYLLMEASTEQILAGKSIHERRAMASTTKIMTALLTLEQPKLDESFLVDAKAVQVEGSSMGLLPGDTVSLRTLAAGMLLSSGNDAANAAAVRIDGSVESFVERMNRRAKQLGLSNTRFETPSGLDGENHYSSAYDLAILAKNALKNEDFAAICSQTKQKVCFGDPPYERTLSNHNKLLSSYEGCIGVKTGFTKKAGRCLVSAAERDGITLICVTLAASDDWNVHKNLLDWGFSQLQRLDLSPYLAGLTVPIAGETQPMPVKTLSNPQAVIPAGKEKEVVLQLLVSPFYYRPLFARQKIGEARFYLDGKLLCSADLFPAEDLPLPTENTGIMSRWRRLFGG